MGNMWHAAFFLRGLTLGLWRTPVNTTWGTSVLKCFEVQRKTPRLHWQVPVCPLNISAIVSMEGGLLSTVPLLHSFQGIVFPCRDRDSGDTSSAHLDAYKPCDFGKVVLLLSYVDSQDFVLLWGSNRRNKLIRKHMHYKKRKKDSSLVSHGLQ